MPSPKILRLVPLALVLAACGAEQAAAPPTPTAGSAGPPPYDAVQVVPVSASGHDRFLTATFDATNRLYAAGFVADGPDQQMAVTRFNADGSLDAGFGARGTATVNVAKGGKAVELVRGVVVQSDGKVVVSGPVEHDPAASGDAAKDTDIALARFDQAGRLDAGFGTGGIVRLDLSTGVADGTAFRGDTAWGLVRVAGDKLLVVGSQVAPGRTDADFAVVRLNADGTRDAGFGSGGTALVGVGAGVSEVPKTAVELQDGKVVVAGYATVAGVVSPVLFRLTTAGALDPSFGDGGIAVRPVLANVGEAYAIALAGNRFVTTGYGKDTPEAKVDLIANGFTLDGALDRSFGADGTTRVDVAGEDDRGRNLVALPDGRTILVGSGKPTAANLDAMVVTLAAGGAETGRKLYDVGGPNDAFFGVALSPDGTRVAVVGYLGRETNGGDKDHGAVLWLRP
ncbi:MAG TPA: delta-60 repeat domain-containing protein [Acidimicrobiales bacterium]|nr:delta-60 repeat domain-containing protein [Acidimicrobiales bacterium]